MGETCTQQGWNLILCNTNDKHERDLSYIQVLADKGVDGIIFCMARDSDKKRAQESIELLEKLNDSLFQTEYKKYASGDILDWELDSLNFFYSGHPLDGIEVPIKITKYTTS